MHLIPSSRKMMSQPTWKCWLKFILISGFLRQPGIIRMMLGIWKVKGCVPRWYRGSMCQVFGDKRWKERKEYSREKNGEIIAETLTGEGRKAYPPQENAYLAQQGNKILPEEGASKISNLRATCHPAYVLFTFVFFGALLAGYHSSANFPEMADQLMEGFSAVLHLLAMPR